MLVEKHMMPLETLLNNESQLTLKAKLLLICIHFLVTWSLIEFKCNLDRFAMFSKIVLPAANIMNIRQESLYLLKESLLLGYSQSYKTLKYPIIPYSYSLR